MAFELPFPPFPHDSRDVPFIATPDDDTKYTVPSSQYFKKLVGASYLWTPVSADDPMPTSDATVLANLADILAKIIAAPSTEAKQTALNALIGEVQAAPTANTLLARLKSLEDKIDAITNGTTPAVTQLSGSKVEVASAQDTQVATTTKNYTRSVGATQIEVFVESGSVRIRTDGQACTATTGEPLGEGWASSWDTESISVYFTVDSTITVVSRQ